MLQKLALSQNIGRQKSHWSLSTEHEQMELWELEKQILKHNDRKVLLVRFSSTAFKIVVQHWKGAA